MNGTAFSGSAHRYADNAATREPIEITEMCLAHLVGNEVERACRRSKRLTKRRELLTAGPNRLADQIPTSLHRRESDPKPPSTGVCDNTAPSISDISIREKAAVL